MNAIDIPSLTKLARTDDNARLILADLWHERGRADVARLWADQLPDAPRNKKRLDKLTKAQTAATAGWAKKWIEIGLSTERADRPLFEAAVAACYRAANLQAPPVIWCPSPLVVVRAGSIAAHLIAQESASGDAVGGAVNVAVDDAVRAAMDDAVNDAVGGAVNVAVDDAVRAAMDDAVGGAVRVAVNVAVNVAVDDAVGGAVRGAVNDAVGGAAGLNRQGIEGWWRYLGGQFWVGGWLWFGSPSTTSFIFDVCGLQIDPRLELASRAYAATAMSACWWWPHSHFVMVSERPSAIEFRDAERQRLKRVQWEGWEVEK